MNQPQPLCNFAVPPMERIRVGFIGIGDRGTVHGFGNTYPTHALGPICLYLDVNHGGWKTAAPAAIGDVDLAALGLA